MERLRLSSPTVAPRQISSKKPVSGDNLAAMIGENEESEHRNGLEVGLIIWTCENPSLRTNR